MELKVTKNKRQELMRSFEMACRKIGMKLTHQRLEIYIELATSTDHPSAETLHERLLKRFPTLSLDTVYRTLATFNLHGLIKKVETVESQARFEVEHERHHHLICSRCKEIVDFRWPSFEGTSLPKELSTWGRIEMKNAIVYGICRKCSG